MLRPRSFADGYLSAVVKSACLCGTTELVSIRRGSTKDLVCRESGKERKPWQVSSRFRARKVEACPFRSFFRSTPRHKTMSRSAESRINSSGTTELAVNQDGSVQTGDKIRILIADDHTSVLAGDRKSTRLNSSHVVTSRMPSSA